MAEQSPPERYASAAARWCGRLAVERGASRRCRSYGLPWPPANCCPSNPACVRVLRSLCTPSAGRPARERAR
jgi:hypothetical protein